MLERRGDYAFDYNLHGGTAPVRMQWLFQKQSRLPVAVQTWELPPGGTEGMHSHPDSSRPLEELYVVMEGTARMTVDGQIHDVAAGDAVLAPVGWNTIWPIPAPARCACWSSGESPARPTTRRSVHTARRRRPAPATPAPARRRSLPCPNSVDPDGI